MSYEKIHHEHSEKVSDKWGIYLSTYSEIFEPYHNKSINYLEIGVQNGGSLEIACKYFGNATHIVGCDIDPACNKLSFSDPRIKLFIGDANSNDIHSAITAHTDSFDIIIDDGSHTSSDIIQTFAKYFPFLRCGGLFIIEDLHCSYWESHQGGLYDPGSSLSYLKALTDVINHEHWGVDKSRSDYIGSAIPTNISSLNDQHLAEIHSITFINSLCIIKKRDKEHNILGRRHIAGSVEAVASGHIEFKNNAHLTFSAPSQTANYWSILENSPAYQYSQLKESLGQRGIIFRTLKEYVTRQEDLLSLSQEKCTELKQELHKQQTNFLEQAQLKDITITRLDEEIRNLNNSILEYRKIVQDRELFIKKLLSSTSWKISAPLRILKRTFLRRNQSSSTIPNR